MSDFSASALLRLVPLGLKRQGIDMPVQAPPRGAHMPVDDKRRLLDAIATSHGESALVRLGEGILDAPDEPVLTAMSLASDPHDLLARWQRLERYVHSKHRVRIERRTAEGMRLHHVSLRGAAAPLRNEDLLVFGLLIGLLEWVGTRALKARFSGERNWRYQHRSWQTATWPEQTGCWELAWSDQDPLLPETAAVDTRARHPVPFDCVGEARNRLALDPARPWTVKALATEMHVAARSLQRSLARHHSSFSSLLANVRATSAAHALTTTAQPLAQIGYACGYADQAHFGRDFKRHTALTPAQYRAEFSGSTQNA